MHAAGLARLRVLEAELERAGMAWERIAASTPHRSCAALTLTLTLTPTLILTLTLTLTLTQALTLTT